MARKICIPHTSRRARVSAFATPSLRRSSATAVLSRTSSLTLYHPKCASLFTTAFQWRCYCRIRVAVHRPQAHDYPLCFLQRGVYPALDPSIQLQRTLSRRVLGPVWRAGRVGRHSHPTGRDEPSWIPCDVPGRRISTRKCERLFVQLIMSS